MPHTCWTMLVSLSEIYSSVSNGSTYWIFCPYWMGAHVCGTFLYYSIAINNTILPALSNISSEQSKSTTNTAKQVDKLLNYLVSNPQSEIQYSEESTPCLLWGCAGICVMLYVHNWAWTMWLFCAHNTTWALIEQFRSELLDKTQSTFIPVGHSRVSLR